MNWGELKGDELYKKRDEILGEMHSDIKHLVKEFDAHVIEDRNYQNKTDESLNQLKAFQWKMTGGIIAAVALVNFLFQVFK